jgi:hypothetical protein
MLYFCNGLLTCVGREFAIDSVLASWRDHLERLEAPVAVANWIDEVAQATRGGQTDRLRMLREPNVYWAKRVAIAAGVVSSV